MGAGKSSVQKQNDDSFSRDEKERIRRCFDKISHKQNAEHFEWTSFLEFTSPALSEPLQRAIYAHMSVQSGQKTVNLMGFTKTLSSLIAATFEQRAELILRICAGAQSTQANKEQIHNFLENLIRAYNFVESRSQSFGSWRFSADAKTFCLANLLAEELKAKDNCYPINAIETWLSRNSLLLVMIETTFGSLFQLKTSDTAERSPTIPFCVDVDWNRFDTILQPLHLFVLNQHIPAQHRVKWRLLYNSRGHGESFSRLVSYVEDKGPCILVIADRDNYVFGGFCSTGLKLGPNFQGDEHCFMFTLQPKIAVYGATGYNTNFVYFNHNQITLVNGLAMGGMQQNQQVRDFGLWLDSQYGNGISHPNCATFGSPRLSANEKFKIALMEVWAVGETDEKPQPVEETNSILDVHSETKAILEMVGTKQHSDGLRNTECVQ